MIVAALPGALAAWAGVTVTAVMFLWNKLDSRFDELKDGLAKLETRQEAMGAEQREEMREMRAEQREEMREMRAEQREEMREMRAEQREDNKALNEKLDRLLESRLPAPR